MRERGRFPEVDDEVIAALYNESHDLALKYHLLVHSVIASVIRLCILPEGHKEREIRASITKGQPVDLDTEQGTEHSRILTEFFEYMYNNVFLVANADETMMEPFINALSFCVGMFITLFNLCRLDFYRLFLEESRCIFCGKQVPQVFKCAGCQLTAIVAKIAKESTGK
jgi:hypothetical protein